MKLNKTILFQKVAFISAPCPLFNRPSIQIGTLKAHLTKKFPELKVDAHHFFKVTETLQNLEFTFSFRPLRMVQFRLGLGSPVWQDPENLTVVLFRLI